MMLLQGLYDLASDVGADMTNGETGTDETLFVNSQTGVITAVAATDIVLTDKTISLESINVTYLLDTSTANGEDIAEYEVNDGSSVAYNRCLKATFGKTDEIEFSLLHSFEFRIVI